MTRKPMIHKGGREAHEMSQQAIEDEYWQSKGDYHASVSENYYYATHPDERRYPMTAGEVTDAIQRYNALVAESRLNNGLEPFLDDNGNLGGIENQQPNRNATTAATTSGCLV